MERGMLPMNTIQHAELRSDLLLTQSELARRWKISPRSLEKWRVLGLGPAYIKIRWVRQIQDQGHPRLRR